MNETLFLYAANFVFSVLGFFFLKRGRKLGHIPWILIGLALILYSFIVSSAWIAWAIGAALVGLAYWLR